MTRWFAFGGPQDPDPKPITRKGILDECHGFTELPTRVLDSQSVVGPVDAQTVRVLVVLRFENANAPLESTGEISHIDMVLKRGRGPAHELKISSLYEVVVHAG